MNIKEVIKSTIIDYLKEDYNPNDSMIDILIKGVPFLKEYNIFKHPRDENRLEAQLISRYENVKMKWGDNDFIVFPYFNSISEITYYSRNHTDYTIHNFIISNELYPSKPDTLTDLEFQVFCTILNQMKKKYSYFENITVNKGEPFPENELNKVLNDMNGCLFKFEDFTEKYNINIF